MLERSPNTTGFKSMLPRSILEFVVLVTGLLMTFYIEDRNELQYRVDLKNQSLKRLVFNIRTDIDDYKLNALKIGRALEYYDRLVRRGDELHASDKDSLGYYLTALSRSSTIFLANDEEYLTLRNSGLIELIESDQLVSVLQERTAGNKAFKKQEDKIIEAEKAVAALVAEKCGKTPVGEVQFQGYPHGSYGTYVHAQPLTAQEINTIGIMAAMCEFYIPFVLNFIDRDMLLIELIEKELPHNTDLDSTKPLSKITNS
jgi:hypothetical protein